jgi:hypothetical protein
MPTPLRTVFLPLATLTLGLGAGGLPGALAEPSAWTPRGYTFELEVTVPAQAEVAWDAFTGDVSPWWDHHFAKAPKALTIAREPGGSFLEIFDEDGHGAEHARVTHAIRGRMLRLVGPLGLVGEGVDVDATLRFLGNKDETQVRLTAHVTGKVTDDLAETVEQVWRHFLIDRYAAHVRGG